MGAVQPQDFGSGGAVALGVGEGADDQLAPVAIDGVVVRHVVRHGGGLSADHSGGEVVKR